MSSEGLRYGFLANHYLLTRMLDTGSLLPAFVSEGIVSPDENTLIRHEITSSLKTDKLLCILHRVGTSNPAVYVKFLDILSDKDITAGQNLDGLVESIKKDSQSVEVRQRFEYTGRVLEDRHQAAVRLHGDTIAKSLDVSSVLPQLVSYGVVTIEESLEIRSKSALTDQSKRLLEVIMGRGSALFSTFVEVLSESDINKHLADILSQSDDTDSPGATTTTKVKTVKIADSDYSDVRGYLRKLPPPLLKDFGIDLGLDPFTVQSMADGFGLIGDIVRAWLRKQDKVKEKCGDFLTWNVLADKLEKFGEQDVADEIRKEKL